ncbi:MAG: Na+/H+ antiporter subunit G [Betaproteobacteria bacterium]
MSGVPMWLEVVVGALLVISGLLSLIAAVGLVRLKDFFQRMHPPALASTLAAWCIALASTLYFSSLQGGLTLQALLINILLAITTPVTTVLLARATLFRMRRNGEDVPPPLVGGD